MPFKRPRGLSWISVAHPLKGREVVLLPWSRGIAQGGRARHQPPALKSLCGTLGKRPRSPARSANHLKLCGEDLAFRITRAMQKKRVFARMTTRTTDGGSGGKLWGKAVHVFGHGVAFGLGRGIKRGPVKYIV